jgi:hypothetical protein
LIFNGLHGVISRKIVLFITIAVTVSRLYKDTLALKPEISVNFQFKKSSKNVTSLARVCCIQAKEGGGGSRQIIQAYWYTHERVLRENLMSIILLISGPLEDTRVHNFVRGSPLLYPMLNQLNDSIL